MRDLSLALPANYTKKKSKSSASVYRLNLSLGVAAIMLGLVYFFVINSLGTKGYEIRKLDQQVRNLEAEQKNLQLEVSDLKSITRIQSEVSELNLVPAQNVTYLKDSDFALK